MDRTFRFRHLVIPAAALLLGLLPAKARAATPPVITLTPAQPAGGYVLCAGTNYALGVSVSDPGAGETLTVNASGIPAFVSLGTPLPTTGNPVNETVFASPTLADVGTYNITITATDNDVTPTTTTQVVTLVVDAPPTVTLSQAGTALTPPVGGFNFVTCVGQPFVLDVSSRDVQAADSTALGVTTSTNGGPAVNGLPLGATQSPNQFGTDTLGPGGSDLLGTSTGGSTFTTRLAFTPTAGELGSTYTVTYVSTDGKCVTTVPVTISVQAPTASDITFVTAPDVTAGTPLADQQICYTATVRDQCGNVMAGEPVTFDLSGVPFTNVTVNGDPVDIGGGAATVATVTATTNALGQAQVCFTSLFPGDINVTASAGGISIAGPTAGVVIISTPGAYVEGSGIVEAAPGSTPPLPGTVDLSLRPRANGTYRGSLDFTVPGVRGTGRGVFRARAVAIDGVVLNSVPGTPGRRAAIFGSLVATGIGLVPFRADAVDVNNPGSPGDSFTITVFLPGGVAPAIIGGPLRFYDQDRKFRGRNDIQIRVGTPTR